MRTSSRRRDHRAISPAMKRATEVARESRGLVRTGLYWGVKFPGGGPRSYFVHRTIQALVDRGLAEYTAWGRPTPGAWHRIPIEVNLTAKATEVLGSINDMEAT